MGRQWLLTTRLLQRYQWDFHSELAAMTESPDLSRRGPKVSGAHDSRRHALLAQGWPTGSELQVTDLGGMADPASWAAQKRQVGELLGGWDDGVEMFRYPPFQFDSNGRFHPRLKALLSALAEHPDRTAETDESGWRRLYWLYQPFRSLSVLVLESEPGTVLEGLSAEATWANLTKHLHKMSSQQPSARTPADAFVDYPDEVIALARRSASAALPDTDAEGNAMPWR